MSGLLEDEILGLANGLLIAQGQVMYRDFFEFMAPFCHLGAAMLVKLFGTGDAYLVAAKWSTAFLTAAASLLMAASARALGVAWFWCLPPLFAYWAGVHRVWPGFGHHAWAWPWLLLALFLATQALREEQQEQAWRWALAGAMASWGLLCTQLEGLIVTLSLPMAASLGAWGRSLGWGVAFRRCAWGFGGGLLGAALVLAPWLLQGALGSLWADLVQFPLHSYRQTGGVNDVPWGADLLPRLQPFVPGLAWHARAWSILAWYLLLPGMALGASIAIGLLIGQRAWFGQPWSSRQAALLPWLGAAVLALLLGVQGKADFPHVLFVAPPALVLAAWVASEGWRVSASPLRSWGERLWAALPGGAYAAWSLALLLLMARTAGAEAWYHPQGVGVRFRSAPDLVWLQAHAAPGDAVVGLPYSGRYVLAGHPLPSRYRLMMPPAAGYNPSEQWAQFRAELRQARPRYVLISAAPALDGGWAPWLAALPQGYQRVAELPPLHPGWGPCRVYEKLERGSAR